MFACNSAHYFWTLKSAEYRTEVLSLVLYELCEAESKQFCLFYYIMALVKLGDADCNVFVMFIW